jgi:hypothetical protein
VLTSHEADEGLDKDDNHADHRGEEHGYHCTTNSDRLAHHRCKVSLPAAQQTNWDRA